MNNINSNRKQLSPEEHEELLRVLNVYFEKNRNRHKDIEWSEVQVKLEANTEKLWLFHEMERMYSRYVLSWQLSISLEAAF